MSWNLITDDWRLKLLAIGLAVLMLGAVAFSQNPPTSKALAVNIGYNVRPGLIVINPPTSAHVQVNGPADILAAVTSNNVAATFDLTGAAIKPGATVHVNLSVRPLISGVQVQDPVVPYVLNIDQMTPVKLQVQVRTQRVAPGWQVTTKEAHCPGTPCVVTFNGPASWETNLQAFADFTDLVQQNSEDVLTQPVILEQNGEPLGQSVNTEPATSLDPLNVTIHIEAVTGTTTRQVVLLDAPPSHGPPAGYRVTKLTIDPITVTVNGSPTALSQITTITLPPVDLSGRTSDAMFSVAIPYPNGISSTVANATLKYSISPNPNVSPSP